MVRLALGLLLLLACSVSGAALAGEGTEAAGPGQTTDVPTWEEREEQRRLLQRRSRYWAAWAMPLAGVAGGLVTATELVYRQQHDREFVLLPTPGALGIAGLGVAAALASSALAAEARPGAHRAWAAAGTGLAILGMAAHVALVFAMLGRPPSEGLAALNAVAGMTYCAGVVTILGAAAWSRGPPRRLPPEASRVAPRPRLAGLAVLPREGGATAWLALELP